MVRGRVFFETRNGTLGLGPSNINVGDIVSQLQGYSSYLILRPIDAQFILIGEGSIFARRTKLEDLEDGFVQGGDGLNGLTFSKVKSCRVIKYYV